MSNFGGYGNGYQYVNDLPSQQNLDPYTNIANDPYNDNDNNHQLSQQPQQEHFAYGIGYHDHDPYANSGSGAYEEDYQRYDVDNGMGMRMDVQNAVEVEGAAESTVGDEEGDGAFDNPNVANLPRILLMGPRRAGKTSIQRVLFHKMSPHETLFRLEPTGRLERSIVDHTPLCRFTIYDYPGDHYEAPDTMDHTQAEHQQYPGTAVVDNNNDGYLDPFISHTGNSQQLHPNFQSPSPQPPKIDFARATVLIFVVDAQDEPYDFFIESFADLVRHAARANPNIAIEVFINKVDGELFLSDDAKSDCRRDVMQRVTDELAEHGADVIPDSVSISYHLTSIYDHSVFEAFSKVVQKLIPQLPTLEKLLDVLVSSCIMEKAFLFDVGTKLYIGTDSGPVDIQSIELCSDMIDVVLDVSGVYGLGNERDENDHPAGDALDASGEIEIASSGAANLNPGGEATSLNSGDAARVGGSRVRTTSENLTAADNTIDENVSSNNNAGDVGFPADGLDYGNDGTDELVGTLISQGAGPTEEIRANETQEVDIDSAYDNESASVIRLRNGMILYMKEVDTMLALVCLTRVENFRKKGLIDYNIRLLKQALQKLVQPTQSTLLAPET